MVRTRRPVSQRRFVRTAALVTVGAGLAAALARDWPEAIDPHRIDVSPFENRTGDPAFDRLSRVTPIQVVKGLVQASRADRRWTGQMAASWRRTPSSRSQVRGRAAPHSGAYERDQNDPRSRVDHRSPRGRVWTVTASGPISSTERILR
jgi:hypothetical protein